MRRAITAALDEAARHGRDEALPEDLRNVVTAETHEPFERRAARFSSAALRVLESARDEADRCGDRQIDTDHVVRALNRTNGTATVSLPPLRGRRPPLVFEPLRWLARYPRLAWDVFVRLSLGHPGFVTNPYPLYRRLRERDPVRRDPVAPVWVLTRYDDTFAMLRDPRFRKDPFAGIRLPPAAREQLGVPVAEAFRASLETVSMLFLDPPQHTRVRAIFTKTFTPRRIEGLRPRIGQMCDQILDRAAARGRIELMGELAAPLPVTVIADLLGFPSSDYAKIKKWSDEMAEALGLNPSPDKQARAQLAREEMRKYFEAVVAHLRRAPADNLLSALLAPDNEALNPDELFANSVLLLAAGHETTTNLIGNGMLALLRHPDQLADLRAHPELIDGAVEELLRYDPPVQWTSRVAGESIALRGHTLRRGEIVLASVGSANRDPEVFKDPDKLDIRRADNKHLSFGTGIHFCLGAALARMEARIVIGTLLARFPNLRLSKQKIRWRKGITFRGVHELWLDI